MKTLLLASLLPVAGCFSLYGCAKDTKLNSHSYSITKDVTRDIYCGSCNTYALTYKVDNSALKDYIFWENIIKPKSHVIDDLSAFSMNYFPLSSIPTLRCSSCYHSLAEPKKVRSGDITRVAFIMSAVKKRSISK